MKYAKTILVSLLLPGIALQATTPADTSPDKAKKNYGKAALYAGGMVATGAASLTLLGITLSGIPESLSGIKDAYHRDRLYRSTPKHFTRALSGEIFSASLLGYLTYLSAKCSFHCGKKANSALNPQDKPEALHATPATAGAPTSLDNAKQYGLATAAGVVSLASVVCSAMTVEDLISNFKYKHHKHTPGAFIVLALASSFALLNAKWAVQYAKKAMEPRNPQDKKNAAEINPEKNL